MAKRLRRRSKGTGTIVPPSTPGGTWRVRIKRNGLNKTHAGLPSRELAQRLLDKLQGDAALNKAGLPADTSQVQALAFYADKFLKRRELTHRAHAEDTGRWTKHMLPAFGHLRPNEVDAGTIRKFVEAKLAGGLSSGTVRIMVSLLSGLFMDLIEDHECSVNPARGLPRKTLRLIKPSHDPRTTPFIEKLIDVDRIYRDLPKPLNVAYALGALAGLRTGEVFALRWRHVDLKARRIHLRESVKGPLKDGDSRIVPILDGLAPILSAWKLESGREGDERVIPPMRTDGHKIHKSTPGKYLRATLEKLALQRPGLGWYEATRHTFASQWVLNGNSIEKLKEILGHYSVVMTERYAHLRVDLFTEKDFGAIPLTLGNGPAPVLPIGPAQDSAPSKQSRKGRK